MEPKLKTSRIRFTPLFIVSAILGIALSVWWFPQTSGSQDPYLERAFSAFIMWVISTYLIYVCLAFLGRIFQFRIKIITFLLNPYPRSVTLVVVALSALPWVIFTLIYWSQVGFGILIIYALLGFIPILIMGLLAAAFLSPRLTFTVAIKLLIGGGIIWIAVVSCIYVFFTIFFEPHTLNPTRDDLFTLSSFFWLAFLAAWIAWSTGLVIKKHLPPSYRQFLTAVNTYTPDLNFIIVSLISTYVYPFTVVALEAEYNSVVTSVGKVFRFTSLDKAAWRIFLGLPSLFLGTLFLIFIVYATNRIFREPIIGKKLLKNPAISTIFILFWLFCLWWIFFSSTATYLNYLIPGEFIFASNSFHTPSFQDFFFYTFEVMTSTASDDIKAIGDGARWLKIVMTLTGILLLALFAEVFIVTFIKNWMGADTQNNSQ